MTSSWGWSATRSTIGAVSDMHPKCGYRWGVGGYGVVQEVVCVVLFTDFIVIFVCGFYFFDYYCVQCFRWVNLEEILEPRQISLPLPPPR